MSYFGKSSEAYSKLLNLLAESYLTSYKKLVTRYAPITEEQEAALVRRYDRVCTSIKVAVRDLPSANRHLHLDHVIAELETRLDRIYVESGRLPSRPAAIEIAEPDQDVETAEAPPVKLVARKLPTANPARQKTKVFVIPRSIFSLMEAGLRQSGGPMTAAGLIAVVQKTKPSVAKQSVYTAISAAVKDGKMIAEGGHPNTVYSLGKTSGAARRAEGGG